MPEPGKVKLNGAHYSHATAIFSILGAPRGFEGYRSRTLIDEVQKRGVVIRNFEQFHPLIVKSLFDQDPKTKQYSLKPKVTLIDEREISFKGVPVVFEEPGVKRQPAPAP